MILCSLVLVICGLHGAKASAEGLSWNVTPRLWFANWENEGGGADIDPTLMFGLSGSVGYNKFVGGISFLTGNFDSEDSSSASRLDTDLFFSYKLVEPYVNLSLGYKLISYDIVVPDGLGNDLEITYDISGFGLGVSGAVPIVDKVFGYYIVSYLPALTLEIEDYEGEQDLSSYNFEIGAGYAINQMIMVSLGYKYQKFDFDEGGGHTVSGVTTAANFNF